MKRTVVLLGLAGLVTAAAVAATQYTNALAEKLTAAQAKVDELQQVVSSTKDFIVGYTKYTDYLSAGEKALSSQVKFVAASVTRNERDTRSTEKSWLGYKLKGAVVVTYSAEYTFGFEMGPSDYALTQDKNEIVITVNRPVLMATPAVKNLHHEVLADGWFINGSQAALNMYELASKRAEEQGHEMASDPAVLALCEKNLSAFVRDFLSKQKGVHYVPAVRVVYRAPKVSPA